jgi:hypothetical protein
MTAIVTALLGMAKEIELRSHRRHRFMSNRRTLPRGYGGICQGTGSVCKSSTSFLAAILRAPSAFSLEEQRKVLGLESVKDQAGNIIQEAPL